MITVSTDNILMKITNLAIGARDNQVLHRQFMHAVANGRHGGLSEELDAGLLVRCPGQVDGDDAFHTIVVFVSAKE